jgi:hypothetical protein
MQNCNEMFLSMAPPWGDEVRVSLDEMNVCYWDCALF